MLVTQFTWILAFSLVESMVSLAGYWCSSSVTGALLACEVLRRCWAAKGEAAGPSSWSSAHSRPGVPL